MTRVPGDQLLVKYQQEQEWHARIVLAHAGIDDRGHDWVVILTPDGDIYEEDVGPASDEIQATRIRVGARLPYGVHREALHDFREMPSIAEIRDLEPEAVRAAEVVRRTLRLTLPQQALVDPNPGLARVPDRGGPVLGRPPEVPALGAGAAHVGGGLAALAAAVGGGKNVARDGVGVRAAADVGPERPPEAQKVDTGDLRTMPVNYDNNGERYRSFASAVELMENVAWPDSPIGGPSTVAWVCKVLRDSGPTPSAWHAKWMSMCRLQASDAAVASHEASCKALEVMMCYDQLNPGALATAELLVRQIQMAEERWKDRMAGGADLSEQRLFGGYDPRGALCICPALAAFVSDELKKESSVMTERRKAREERALTKPQGGQPPKKGE
eukprot:6129877-Amphidinium_carterae.2